VVRIEGFFCIDRQGDLPCRQTRKLALTRCRGVRRMHLKQNVSGWEQAPTQTHFILSAHGSLLRASISSSDTVQSPMQSPVQPLRKEPAPDIRW